MKKIFCLVLTLVLSINLTVTTLADKVSNTGGNSNVAVKGTAIPLDNSYDIVSVGVSWGAMKFTFTDNSKYWIPEGHNTATKNNASWKASGNDITVTNHSNVKISADFAFSPAVAGLGGNFYNLATNGTQKTSLTLDRALEASALDSVKDTVYFLITGGTISENKNTLGIITVSIAKKS